MRRTIALCIIIVFICYASLKCGMEFYRGVSNSSDINYLIRLVFLLPFRAFEHIEFLSWNGTKEKWP